MAGEGSQQCDGMRCDVMRCDAMRWSAAEAEAAAEAVRGLLAYLPACLLLCLAFKRKKERNVYTCMCRREEKSGAERACSLLATIACKQTERECV